MPKISNERKELIESLQSLGHDDDVKGKSVVQLKSMIKKYKEANSVLDSIDTTLDSALSSEEQKEVVNEVVDESSSIWKKMSRPEWTDYVLSLMESHEKDQGHPKVDGLRRVALKLLGPYEIRSDVKQVPGDSNGYRATVTANIIFSEYGVGVRTYSGSADVSKANTAKEFANHPIATAETRPGS